MDIRSRFESLSKAVYLDVTLPKIDIDAAALLSDGRPEQIAQAPTRRNLFFDEYASLLIVLRTSTSESELRNILPELELVLTAHATDAVPQGSGNAASASGKHDINSALLQGTSYTDIISCSGKTYVIWKPVLHLLRPRARLQRPAIYFTANLSISSNDDDRISRNDQKEYLKSYEPLPANVLEPLHFDPAFGSSNIFLSESRITKVAPKASSLRDTIKPVRGASKRAFPVVPALFSKVKFSTLPDAIIMSLHLETSHVISGTVTIDRVGLETRHAQIEHLTDFNLPMNTKAGDETILLYRIKTTSKKKMTDQVEAPITISIIAHAYLEQDSHIALDLSWQTHLDLGQTIPKPLYKWSRPLTTTSGHHRGLSTQSNPTIVYDVPHKHGEGEPGIIFSFTAAATMYRNSEFKINVLCNNRTGRQRRFALLMLQPRKSRLQALATGTEADLVANIFSRPPLERTKPPDVLELTPDARIGPVPPGARFETHLRFQALGTGVLDLGVLRILDLDTRQMVDVRELPDIISLEVAESAT